MTFTIYKCASHLFGISTSSRLTHLLSLSQQFFPELSQPSLSFSSTLRRKAIATVWLPSSPFQGRQSRARVSLLSVRATQGFGSPTTRGSTRKQSAGQRPAPRCCPRNTHHGSLPSPVTALRLPTGGGAGPSACARRSRACRPHYPPPTRRACHFLPSPHLRPGSVSRSLSQPESLCFPLLTRSLAVAQALRGGGDGERERLT